MKERIIWLDIAKCIAITLVIYNHITMSLGQTIIKYVIASFHMPLFFVLSGFTIDEKKINNYSFFKYVKNKFYAIMIPYYIWTFIYSEGVTAKSIFMILWANNQSIRQVSSNAVFWFLPCFFISIIIIKCEFWASGKIKAGNSVKAVIMLINFIMGLVLTCFVNIFHGLGWPFSLNIAFIGSGFILLGFLMLYPVQKKIAMERMGFFRENAGWLLLFFSATVLFAFLNRNAVSNSYSRVVMARSYWGNIIYFILSGLMGSLMIVTLSAIIAKIKFIGTHLCKIGRNTLVIFAIHITILSVIEKCMVLVCGGGQMRFEVIISILIAVCCLGISYSLALLIQYLIPELAGKRSLGTKLDIQ